MTDSIKHRQDKNAGFTLLEIVVICGLLLAVMTMVIIAINPAGNVAKANNAKRKSDLLSIMNAIHQYTTENKTRPATFSTDPTQPSPIRSNNGVNFCAALVPKYIAKIPVDPSITSGVTDCNDQSFDSGYAVYTDPAGRVTITAPLAEMSETITATR